jgi:hypothetical protein
MGEVNPSTIVALANAIGVIAKSHLEFKEMALEFMALTIETMADVPGASAEKIARCEKIAASFDQQSVMAKETLSEINGLLAVLASSGT